MDIVIYSGAGATPSAVQQVVDTLSSLLPAYNIKSRDAQFIVNGNWQSSTALLVIPGGPGTKDVKLFQAFGGPKARSIFEYVQGGGNYLGLCAGGYGASGTVEFETHSKNGFIAHGLPLFEGTCRGCAYRGYTVNSPSGSKAAKVSTSINGKDETATVFWHGGGVFVDADSFDNVTVLSNYVDRPDVEGGTAAIIKVKSGKGTAILTAVHPEFQGKNVKVEHGIAGHREMVNQLIEADELRDRLMRYILSQFNLEVSKAPYGGDTINEKPAVLARDVRARL